MYTMHTHTHTHQIFYLNFLLGLYQFLLLLLLSPLAYRLQVRGRISSFLRCT